MSQAGRKSNATQKKEKQAWFYGEIGTHIFSQHLTKKNTVYILFTFFTCKHISFE